MMKFFDKLVKGDLGLVHLVVDFLAGVLLNDNHFMYPPITM